MLCLLPAALAPLLAGTGGRPYTLIIAGLCGVVGVVVGAHEWRRGRALALSWFAAFLALAMVVALLQLVPLPAGLRALLAPGSDAALRQISGPLGGYPGRPHALSVDPAATGNEALRLAGYLALLLALGAAFSQRKEGLILQRAVALIAGGVAALGALAALGVTLPPLLEVPSLHTRAHLAAAFINSNHMAALLSMGAIMTTSLLIAVPAANPGGLRGGAEPRRLALLLLLFLLDLALLGTLSRGGIATGLLGQIVVLLWPRATRRRAAHGDERRRAALRQVAIGLGLPLLLCGLALALLGEAQRDLQARVAGETLGTLWSPGSKVRAWHESLRLLRGHLWLGVGRGAFENAFQSTNSIAARVRFPYLENEPLQLFLDYGVAVALALLALLGLGLRSAGRRLWQDHQRGAFAAHRVGAAVALGALGLHNLVDFSLEVGGVAVPALLLCALVSRGRTRMPAPLLVGLGALVMIGSVALWPLARSSAEDGARLLALADNPASTSAQVEAAGRAALLRHPLDAHLADLVAARLLWEHAPQTLEWANRALIANPQDVSALRVAALVLAEQGRRSQALVTLRHAIPLAGYTQRLQLYHALLATARSPSQVLGALPPVPQVADEVLEIWGNAAAPRWSLVRAVAAWADGLRARSGPIWLARAALAAHDLDTAARQGERLAQAGDAPLLLSGIVAALVNETPAPTPERLRQAEALCQSALLRAPRPEVLIALALVQERSAAVERARQTLERALGEASDNAMRAQVLEARAGLEERQGNIHRAEQERSEAAHLRP